MKGFIPTLMMTRIVAALNYSKDLSVEDMGAMSILLGEDNGKK